MSPTLTGNASFIIDAFKETDQHQPELHAGNQ